ncbi:glutathione S-transferase family protein [Pseudosulfitobacter koreensis]|uniref:Glutathione S-transferase n=1 Tax=Pseudosulfitobacter koreensis TaxID=2968472 RepID=A0ABT1Z129_9RHOB|nr:glutathione S-transferase [Pseudosulfitobacter koreense]MCR8826842.1 glutathione S-transferase [Pseudosulfitobacter koreense]
MYTVIGATKSRALRVMWLLEELGEAYDQDPAGPRSDTVLKHNVLGKIPALIDEGHSLTDSVAIMTYLADKHGKFTAPAGTPQRAHQDAMTLWLIDEVDATLWTNTRHKDALPDLEARMHEQYAQAMKVLSNRLQSEFLMGDEMTVPDILAAHCMGWAAGVGFPPLDEKLSGYLKKLRARPAFRAALDH